MKASELIKNLKQIIEENGDLDVAFQNYFEQDNSCIYDMDFVCYVEQPNSKDTVYDDVGTEVERDNVIAINHTF